MRRLLLPLTLALALAGCRTPVAATQAARVATASPGPQPTAMASPQAPLARVLPALLAKPAGPTHELAGVVALDASYLLASKAGTLISQDGGGVVAVAPLISQDGGGLVAQGAGNLISQDGGGLTGTRAARRRVLQAPAVGQQVPAAGMWIRALALDTNLPVSLGEDAGHKPVYAVATDARGRFTIYLPASQVQNVRLVASVPHSADLHLTYNHLLPPDANPKLDLDEPHALLSTYLRKSSYGRLVELLFSVEQGGNRTPKLEQTIRAASPMAGKLLDRADANQAFKALSAPDQRRVIQQVADLMLARIDLNGARSDNGSIAPDQQARMTAGFGELAKAIQARLDDPAWGAAGLAARPWIQAGVERRAAGGLETPALTTSSAVMDLMADQYLGSLLSSRIHEEQQALADLGMDPATTKPLIELVQSVATGLNTFLLSGADTLADQFERQTAAFVHAGLGSPPPAPQRPPAADGVVTTLADFAPLGSIPYALAADGQGHLYVAEINRRIRQLDLADPRHPVTPFAGGDEDNAIDGPLASARFAAIRAMAFHEDKLYLAEVGDTGHGARPGGVIRMIDLKAPGQPVTTLAGSETEAGALDGPGATARFMDPEQLIVDAVHQRLLITDQNNFLVRALDLAAPGYPVSTVLGVRGGTTADGLIQQGQDLDDAGRSRLHGNAWLPLPAPQASLLGPRGLCLDGAGALVLVDHTALRRLGGDGMLRMLAGDNGGTRDGYWMDAQLSSPNGTATLPDGDLLVVDGASHRVRRVHLDPSGLAGRMGTWAGKTQTTPGVPVVDQDGKGLDAAFRSINGVAVDPHTGLAYLSELEGSIRQIAPAP